MSSLIGHVHVATDLAKVGIGSIMGLLQGF